MPFIEDKERRSDLDDVVTLMANLEIKVTFLFC